MKRSLCILLCLILLSGLFGCAPAAERLHEGEAGPVTPVVDSLGHAVDVPEDPRVVCLYGSYADAWLSAGGALAGVTEDAVEERALDVGEAEIVGTVKEPNAEAVLALAPDWVVYNPDITGQSDIRDVLENAGLACSGFRVDGFEDYAAMMEQFCAVTGRKDLFEQNVTQVRGQIEAVVKAAAEREETPTVLLMRAFASGVKAKTDDELAGALLKDLGAHNIADDHPSMLEELSLEEVIRADPEYIFVTTMGSEKKALDYLQSQIDENPAWQEMTAVKEGRYFILPKDLFHYKPNARWGESYEYLARCLFPD